MIIKRKKEYITVTNKKGNTVLALFPLFTILFIAVLFIISIIYSQILIGVINIKSDVFYIVQNSIIKLNKEELSYGEYILAEDELKEEISNLILKNYMLDGKGNRVNRSAGVLDVVVSEVKYYTKEREIIEHTGGKYNEEFIHIVLTVRTKTVLNIGIKDTYDTKIHEDIKLTRFKTF